MKNLLLLGGPRKDPGYAGETMSLGWPGNASGSPGRAGRNSWGEGSLGSSPWGPILDKRQRMDGWMDVINISIDMF